MKSLTVHVLLYQEEEHFVAHCLEFDLVAQGLTESEAFQNLLDAIDLQAAFAMETGEIENLMQPAPLEYWRMLARAESCELPYDRESLPTILASIDCGVFAGQ